MENNHLKNLALSKIIHLALVKTIPNATVNQLSKVQKDFIWNEVKPKKLYYFVQYLSRLSF